MQCNLFKKLFFFLLVMLVPSCSLVNTAVQKQVGDMLARDIVLLDADSFGKTLVISHKVDVNFSSKQFSLIQQTEIDVNEIRLVGLTHFGAPFFTIIYSGLGLNVTKMEVLPEAFRPEMVLRDFQIAFWPIVALQSVYAVDGFSIEDAGLSRRLKKDGEEFMTVVYQDKDRLKGKVQLLHHKLGYRIEFETLNVQGLEE